MPTMDYCDFSNTNQVVGECFGFELVRCSLHVGLGRGEYLNSPTAVDKSAVDNKRRYASCNGIPAQLTKK